MPDPRQEDIDELMKVLASADLAKGPPPPAPPAEPPPAPPRKDAPPRPAAARMDYEPLVIPTGAPRSEAGLDFLSDVDVHVRVELGKTRMNVQDVLKLGSGSVVGLDSLVGEPVSVYVNDRLVARGEVLVVDDRFAVRITEVIPLPKGDK